MQSVTKEKLRLLFVWLILTSKLTVSTQPVLRRARLSSHFQLFQHIFNH